MAKTATNVPDEHRWAELSRGMASPSGQIQALVVGVMDSERVGGLEQTIYSVQEAIQNMAQRHGAGTRMPAHHFGFNSFVGKTMVSQGAINMFYVKHRKLRCKSVVGAKDESFKAFLEWTKNTRKTNAATIVSETSGVVDALRLAQHIYASLPMNMETGAKPIPLPTTSQVRTDQTHGGNLSNVSVQRRLKPVSIS